MFEWHLLSHCSSWHCYVLAWTWLELSFYQKQVWLDQQQSTVQELMKSELINMTGVWDKEKHLSPRQELNPWRPKHCVGNLSTELRELIESKVIYLLGAQLFSLSHAYKYHVHLFTFHITLWSLKFTIFIHLSHPWWLRQCLS